MRKSRFEAVSSWDKRDVFPSSHTPRELERRCEDGGKLVGKMGRAQIPIARSCHRLFECWENMESVVFFPEIWSVFWPSDISPLSKRETGRYPILGKKESHSIRPGQFRGLCLFEGHSSETVLFHPLIWARSEISIGRVFTIYDPWRWPSHSKPLTAKDLRKTGFLAVSRIYDICQLGLSLTPIFIMLIPALVPSISQFWPRHVEQITEQMCARMGMRDQVNLRIHGSLLS